MNSPETNESKHEALSGISEAVSKVFQCNPELGDIGTEKEYLRYLETIFPESVFRSIVWHNSDVDFKEEGFKPTQPKFDTLNSMSGVFNFTTDADFAQQYGKYAYSVLLDIRKPYMANTTGEYQDDMDEPLSKALFVIGRQKTDNFFAPKSKPEHADDDAVINICSGEGYRGVDKAGKYMGIPSQTFVAVFDPGQIHILGSRADMEAFKCFVDDN